MAINAVQTLILNALGLVPLYDIWMSKAVVADEYPCEEFKKKMKRSKSDTSEWSHKCHFGKGIKKEMKDQGTVSNQVLLTAKPEPLEIDLRKTGIIIIDMQNAFLAKGAYVDLLGVDIQPSQATIEPIKRISQKARGKGVKIIYFYIVHYPEDDGGGPDSVHWHKEASLRLYRAHPEYADKLPLPNTWGAEMVKELTPQKGDVVIEKPRYSGFFDTNIRTVLKRYGLQYLIVTGVNTNCCVESTIREAYHHGYFSIMVSDATAANGPVITQEATIINVQRFFGWVTNSEDVLKALQ